jgi:RNA polymerase sigma-70 factor (ECF subfamily)
VKTILSDEILISRIAQGDRQALEILYDRHAAMVLGILVRILGERALAEEILQETFWHIWQSVPIYHPQNGSFTSWLAGIARKLAINKRRRNDYSQEITEQPPFGAQGELELNIFENIPDDQRQILGLAYFYGMTRQQIANVTGETLETVSTLARLGLQKLEQELRTRKK